MHAVTASRLPPAVVPQLMPFPTTTSTSTGGHHAVHDHCTVVVPPSSLALIDHHSDALSQPLSGTSGDFDDAIMESMDMDLFEPDDPPPSLLSHSTLHRSSNRLLSSSAMACLAHGFSRLPDEAGNSVRAPVGTGGGIPHTASASLAAVLRGGSTTAGAGDVPPGLGPTMSSAAVLHASVVSMEALTMKPPGVTHDGAMSTQSTALQQPGLYNNTIARPMAHFTGLCLENHPLTGDGVGAVAPGVASATAVTSLARRCEEVPRVCDRPKSHSAQLADTSHPYSLQGAAGSQQYSPSALSTSTLINAGAEGSGGGGAGDISTIGVGAVGGSGVPSGAGSACSGTSSSVHPALAHVLASAAAAARSGGIGSGVNTQHGPRPDLNLPFAITSDAVGFPDGAIPDSGLAVGGYTTAPMPSAAPVPARTQVGWGLGAAAPVMAGSSGSPVSAAVAQPSQLTCLHTSGGGGSIAAAAFRFTGILPSQPCLDAPGGGPGGAVGGSLPLLKTTRNPESSSTTLSGAVGQGYLDVGQRFAGVPPQRPYSEPWGGMRGGGVCMYDMLPDAGGAPLCRDSPDAVTAAVRAVLRGNEHSIELQGMGYGGDLPLQQPPVNVSTYGCLPNAPMLPGYYKNNNMELPHPSAPPIPPPPSSSAPWMVSQDASCYPTTQLPHQLLQPLQPPQPLPLPHAGMEPFKPAGVMAVDRYLLQLLQDTGAERHVFLCKQPLGLAACQAIANCLRVCRGVKSITLSYCGITCEGLAALAAGLRTCHDLLVLDLSYNNIAEAGVAALTAVLPGMPHLATMILDGNLLIGDGAAAALAATARSGGCLRRVSMRGTAASALGLKDLASAQASNARRMARRVGFATGLNAGISERPVTWDGVTTASVASAGGGTGFISQLCSLLRTLVRPTLVAEQAVAEAVAELMAAAPGLQPPVCGGGNDTSADGAASSAVGFSINTSRLLSYLADGLRDRGYEVAVTQALGGGPGGECLRNLRHTFLSVMCPPPPGDAAAAAAAAASSLAGSLAGQRRPSHAPAQSPPLPYHAGVIIVDPELKEQFEVAMPTPRYEALVSALPRVYVGAEERLPLVVEVLCDEMALALRTKGLVIPPWRESAAMISKWQPKQAKMLIPGYGSNASINTLPGATDVAVAAAGVSYSVSVHSSGNITPRVSLADGMGAATAAAMAPVPVHWRCDLPVSGVGAGGCVGGIKEGFIIRSGFPDAGDGDRDGSQWTRNTTTATVPSDGDSEPSLGPAPSLGSMGQGTEASSRKDTTTNNNSNLNFLGRQSFGFRRCTSEKGMLVSVGFIASGCEETTDVTVAPRPPTRPADGVRSRLGLGALFAGRAAAGGGMFMA